MCLYLKNMSIKLLNACPKLPKQSLNHEDSAVLKLPKQSLNHEASTILLDRISPSLCKHTFLVYLLDKANIVNWF